MRVVTNNKRQYRFEILLDNSEIAFLEYRWLKGSMVLMRTLVPAEARGKGIASQLVHHVLEHARAHRLHIIVYCPFVQKYIQAHPEYAELIDESHKK